MQVRLQSASTNVAATSDRQAREPMSTQNHLRPAHKFHTFQCSGTQQSCRGRQRATGAISDLRCRASLHIFSFACPHSHFSIISTILFTSSAIKLLFPVSETFKSTTMACAAVCSSGCAAGSRIWTSDVPRHDFFSRKGDVSLNKVASTVRRSPVTSAAMSSSSEASTNLNGRHPNARFDQSYPVTLATNFHVNTDATCNVERWVEESVHEIVKNIQEAPFLQYVFDSKSRFSRSQRQKITQEKCWPSVRDSLSEADPDGVIFVQKLEPGCGATCCLAAAMGGDAEAMVCPLSAEGAETSVWGVLVQGRRGSHTTNACYLLKTTRVSSSAGAFTRYCLTRATCFGPSYVEQFENAWLL